jgi:hypothetical protein
VRRNKLVDRSKAAATEVSRHGVSPRRIGIHNSDESHGCALLCELAVNASVIPTKRSHTDHGDVDQIVSGQISILSRQVAAGPVDLITKGPLKSPCLIRTVTNR